MNHKPYDYFEQIIRMKHNADKFELRLRMIRFATQDGVKPAARAFDTTPKTVRKWLRRYRQERLAGLNELLRIPLFCPHKISASLERKIVALRKRFPFMGAKRLRDVCKIKEDEKLWLAGRGFVVRDLPWSEKQLREIPPFEFENWAVIALGGIPNKAQVGDMGIDGRIYPASAMPRKKEGELEFMDVWYPSRSSRRIKWVGLILTHSRW